MPSVHIINLSGEPLPDDVRAALRATLEALGMPAKDIDATMAKTEAAWDGDPRPPMPDEPPVLVKRLQEALRTAEQRVADLTDDQRRLERLLTTANGIVAGERDNNSKMAGVIESLQKELRDARAGVPNAERAYWREQANALSEDVKRLTRIANESQRMMNEAVERLTQRGAG